MPVVYFGRDIYHISRIKHLGFFAPFLIVSSAAYAYKYLAAALFGVMDMPVVSASGLKGYIIYTYLPNGYGSKIALADEILLESVLGSPTGKSRDFS